MRSIKILAPAIISAFGFAAQAQDLVSSDLPADLFEGQAYNNPFDCWDAAQFTGKGPLGSAFANAFWGNNECGNYDIANQILEKQFAPPTTMQIPGVEDIGVDGGFAACYFQQLPYGVTPIIRERDILDGTVTVSYGPYSYPEDKFNKLHAVISNICTPDASMS